MRREIVVAACTSLLALASTGCISPRGQEAQTDPSWHEARTAEAFHEALDAEDPREQELWQAEYERRVRSYESQATAESSARAARFEVWRQFGAAVQEVGVLILSRP